MLYVGIRTNSTYDIERKKGETKVIDWLGGFVICDVHYIDL